MTMTGVTIRCVSVLLFAIVSAVDIVRDTTNGKVLGTLLTELGIEVYLGIPYALPPTNELRWKPPVSYPSWNSSGESWNATSKRSVCPQYDETTAKTVGDEDCLFLNIYVPRTSTSSSELHPAMVFIHPGAFRGDSGSSYDGSILARHGKVIVVTFNYRLGALGFLSTGDSQVRGNFGLLDQKAALEWVQDNIIHFQGDSNKVTVFGSAAGGVSTLLHALSPQNSIGRKLFQRVIGQSGSPFCRWGFQSDPRYHALRMIKSAGCPDSTTLGIQCLKGKNASDIVQWQRNYATSTFTWVPSIDGNYITDRPDFMISNENLVTRLTMRYQYIIGTTDFETSWDYYTIKDIHNRDGFINFLREMLRDEFENYDEVAQAAALAYIDPLTPPATDLEWQHLSFNASRDYLFLAPSLNMTYFASSEQGLSSTVYHYLFAHKPGQGLVNAGAATQSADIVDGAAHKDDLSYIFGTPLTLANITDADRQISLQMMTYWTNFANTGNPSSGIDVDTIWPEFDLSSRQYLQFGNKDPALDISTIVKERLQSNEVEFWTRKLAAFQGGLGNGLSDHTTSTSNETPAEYLQSTSESQYTKALVNVK